jgi:tripartite-type tricarboxylate transporter receptor subunit TctC
MAQSDHRSAYLRNRRAPARTRLPDVPAIGEFLPGYEASGINGFGAPKSTPADIIETLNKEINAGLRRRLGSSKSNVLASSISS